MVIPETIPIYIGFLVWMVVQTNLFLKERKHAVYREKTLSISVWIVAIVLWPLVWYTISGKCKSFAALTAASWPILALAFEIYSLCKYNLKTEGRRGLVQMDASTLCSMTFALSGVLGARRSNDEARIFHAAVLFCIAFVMPSFTIPRNTFEGTLLEALQKAFLIYSTGFLLSGSMHLVCGCDTEKV